LMQQHGLSEQDSFRSIQKLAMQQRKSMAEVAEQLLSKSET